MSNNEGHVIVHSFYSNHNHNQLFIFDYEDDDNFLLYCFPQLTVYFRISSTKKTFISSMTSENASVSATATSKSQEQLERKSRWASKRERERNKSRFEISQRIQRVVDGVNAEKKADRDIIKHDDKSWTETEMKELQAKYIQAIETGSSSTFSLRNLHSHHDIISQPVPLDVLDRQRFKEICTSRFGVDYANNILRYLSPLEDGGKGHITMIDYAALIGEYDTIKGLVLGGFIIDNIELVNASRNHEQVEHVIKLVCQKFHVDKIPLTLTAYLVKSVMEMRMQGWSHSHFSNSCTICSEKSEQLLCFSNKCNHIFCELCFWEDLVRNLHSRHPSDVILCPICSDPYSQEIDASKMYISEMSDLSPSRKKMLSLERYESLPDDSNALKALRGNAKITRKKFKNKRNAIHTTWHDAIISTLGSSKEVRRDKFLRSIESGNLLSVSCCLEAGVDIDMTNEYSQTALYIACWRGHLDIINKLLDWGADPKIQANGGMSCWNAAQRHAGMQHNGISELLLEKNGTIREYLEIEKYGGNKDCAAKMLIETKSDHEGAGSFIIDECLNRNVLQNLDKVFQSIPVHISEKELKQKKSKPCSKRSYFCDSEGAFIEELAKIVRDSSDEIKDVYFFPHMRFLNYDQPTGWLAPHTDLPRTDVVSGIRSTHTFILYMTDCDEGGETALLVDQKSCEVLTKVNPRRGRLFLFPHECPHEGCETITQKILLRGEASVRFH